MTGKEMRILPMNALEYIASHAPRDAARAKRYWGRLGVDIQEWIAARMGDGGGEATVAELWESLRSAGERNGLRWLSTRPGAYTGGEKRLLMAKILRSVTLPGGAKMADSFARGATPLILVYLENSPDSHPAELAQCWLDAGRELADAQAAGKAGPGVQAQVRERGHDAVVPVPVSQWRCADLCAIVAAAPLLNSTGFDEIRSIEGMCRSEVTSALWDKGPPPDRAAMQDAMRRADGEIMEAYASAGNPFRKKGRP